MHKPDVMVDRDRPMTPPQPTRLERIVIKTLKRVFGAGTVGRLDVLLPSGFRVSLGHDETPAARLVLNSMSIVHLLATRGSLGPAEAYMRGDIDTPDLSAVLRFCLQNYDQLERQTRGLMRFKPRFLDVLWHRRRSNTVKGSRRNIAAHYDLGNAFYRPWLDPGMTYSSGIYRDPETRLTDAQEEKYRVVLDAAGIKDGDRVLEIGCGWGGFAERAARRGAHVTGLTLSTEQLSFARDRMSDLGFAQQADLRLQDYRAVDGQYDAVVSIEMIEAVGEEHWPDYFRTLNHRLKPGGRAVVQAITIDERFFESYRRQADFIQRYIFPGGMLPTVTRMGVEAEAVGLQFETIERFGKSYAQTLRDWRERFEMAWPDIAPLGFDDRFRRMWLYYLSYCDVGFDNGDIDVGIYAFDKPAV